MKSQIFRIPLCSIVICVATHSPVVRAELIARELDGNANNGPEAYYDSDLNVTWLASIPSRAFTYDDAKAWAEQTRYGISGWRLPKVEPVNGKFYQYNFSNNGITDYGYAKPGTGWGSASEMGHLYYVEFRNQGYCTPNDALPYTSCDPNNSWGSAKNDGPFKGTFANHIFWTSTPWPIRSGGWYFDFNSSYGNQQEIEPGLKEFAMAVHDGDVLSAVPEPRYSHSWIYGLLVLGLIRRQKTNHSQID